MEAESKPDIGLLMVEQGAQWRGIGQKMLRTCIEIVEDRATRRKMDLQVWVVAINDSHEFYEKNEFEPRDSEGRQLGRDWKIKGKSAAFHERFVAPT